MDGTNQHVSHTRQLDGGEPLNDACDDGSDIQEIVNEDDSDGSDREDCNREGRRT